MKSHVSMEQHQCIVCGALYDTGSILLDKRLRASMDMHTVTGNGFCPEHQKMKDDGYVALVEADEKTNLRSGRIAHIRASAWSNIFNIPVPDEGVALVPVEVMDFLQQINTDDTGEVA